MTYELRDDLTQKHLIKFEKAAFPRGKTPEVATVELRVIMVKAAVQAGWLVGDFDPGSVDQLSLAEIAKLHQLIQARYVEAISVDPNS